MGNACIREIDACHATFGIIERDHRGLHRSASGHEDIQIGLWTTFRPELYGNFAGSYAS
jgi:hypothetical protein